MSKLLIYLKDYKKETILGPLFKLLEAVFELFVPLVIAAMIDVGIHNRDKEYIMKMWVILIALAVVGLASALVAQYFAAKAAVGFATKLRHNLFAQIQKFSYRQLDEVGTSTLITRITGDVNMVQAGVNMVLRLFLRSPFIVFGAMIMAFTIHAGAARVFVVVIFALFLVVVGIMRICIPHYTRNQQQLDAVLRSTRESLTGSRVWRAFCLEEEEMERFAKKNSLLHRMQLAVGRIASAMNPLTYVVVNAGIICILYQGGHLVSDGVISQGAVVALVNYMSQILVELVKLANLIVTINKAIACGDRISLILDMQENEESDGGHLHASSTSVKERKRVQDITSHAEYMVEFRDVSMCYHKDGEEAISHITMQVKRGETVGIIGGTGAGKSTVVNMIPGFYPAKKGAVYVDGADIRAYTKQALREKIGIVPQKAVLCQGTIRENLKWGNEHATDEEIYEALRVAQAINVIEAKKNGLDAKITQGGKNLSGGQRQRLTIARALVKHPDILILDDSASALDYATDAALRAALAEHCKDMTTFIVSQRTASVMHADHILVLEDGQMEGWGTHEELLASCEVYREIHESQYGGVSK